MNLDETRYTTNSSIKIKEWSDFLRATRAFFYANQYQEVTTSYLVEAGAFESAIDPLRAKGHNQSWELHTSPEMEMKRLLAAVKTDIFQIAKCFRDDPDTEIHGKEFTMLEFYKVGASYLDVIEQTKQLFQSLSLKKITFKEVTIENLFQERLKIDLNRLVTFESLAAALKEKQILTACANDSWEDLFFKVMIEKIEPSFELETAYIVRDYPTVTSALSKKIEGTPYSERFEIYWKGMELCNGCTESTSLEELKRNYEKESFKRKQEKKEPHPFPKAFLDSLFAFPSCSGVAVGLDRLFRCIL